MVTSEWGQVFLTKFVRRLRGGSQPILAQASDGYFYVVKFSNNPQGPNLPFNECVGTELYRAMGLDVPQWRPVEVKASFLRQYPECRIQMEEGVTEPESGVCFASRYLGGPNVSLYEILPSNRFTVVRNVRDFWLAWLIDICAGHTDNRQAIFLRETEGALRAVFVDHGHLFCGPNGDKRSHFVASRYLDSRVYLPLGSSSLLSLQRAVHDVDTNQVFHRAKTIPSEWQSESGFRNLAECLNRLSSRRLIQSALDAMMDSLRQSVEHDESKFIYGFKRTRQVLLSQIRA